MPSRYRVSLAEVDTGIVLREDGTRFAGGETTWEHAFESRAKALAAKDALLARFPFAEVWIRDDDDPKSAERFVDDEAYARFVRARDAWTRWRLTFPLLRLFRRRPPNP